MTKYLAIVLMVLPCAGLAQALLERAPTTEQHYLDLITQEQEAGGPSARALIEPMTSLGLLYLEQRDYERAAETLARARGVMRATDGFDTLPEMSLIAHQVRVEEARGDLESAWELEQGLLAVAGQHAGALATLPIYQEVLRKRREVLVLYRAGELPSQIVLGCYYDGVALQKKLGLGPLNFNEGRQCRSGSSTNVIASLLIEIRNYQLHALEALFQNGLYASDEMDELVSDVLRTSEQVRPNLPGFLVMSGDSFANRLLTQLLAYQPRTSAERVRRAHFLVLAADLNVLRAQRSHSFREYDTVLAQYRQAYVMLQQEGVAQAELDEVFAPARPVALPAYNAGPLRGSEEAGAAGYIDVEFELTRRGLSRDVAVTGASESVKRGSKRELVRRIEDSSFRPRLEDGDFPEASRMSLRYHVHEDNVHGDN